METLVRLSFYCFAASSVAIGLASLSYIAYTVGRVRVRRAIMATSAGTTVTSSTAEIGPGNLSFGQWGTMLTWFGAVFAFLAVLLRTIAAERLPTANMYEFSLTFVLAISILYLAFERMYRIRQLGAIVLPVAFGMTVYIWSLPTDVREITPLIPALQARPIMTVHVASGIFAYAAFAVSFAAAVLFLLKQKWGIRSLPSLEVLDDVAFRAVGIGFPLLSLLLILGSVWAHDAWGVYWSWDPKETASLVTWLIYGGYLHARVARGWVGRGAAWLLVIAFASVIFTFFGNAIFGGLHSYGVV